MSKVSNHIEDDDAFQRYTPESLEDKYEGGAAADASKEETEVEEMLIKDIDSAGIDTNEEGWVANFIQKVRSGDYSEKPAKRAEEISAYLSPFQTFEEEELDTMKNFDDQWSQLLTETKPVERRRECEATDMRKLEFVVDETGQKFVIAQVAYR